MAFDEKLHVPMRQQPKTHQKHKELPHQIIRVLPTTIVRMQMHHDGCGFVSPVAQKVAQQRHDRIRPFAPFAFVVQGIVLDFRPIVTHAKQMDIPQRERVHFLRFVGTLRHGQALHTIKRIVRDIAGERELALSQQLTRVAGLAQVGIVRVTCFPGELDMALPLGHVVFFRGGCSVCLLGGVTTVKRSKQRTFITDVVPWMTNADMPARF